MKSRLVKGVEVQRGSGNAYADLDLPNAEKLKIKSGLAIEIRKAMRKLSILWSMVFLARSRSTGLLNRRQPGCRPILEALTTVILIAHTDCL